MSAPARWLIAGGNGMLGRDLQWVLGEAGAEVTALGHRELDVTDPVAVREAVAGFDVVVNSAAYTRVDDAETEQDAAYAVNATAAGTLASASAAAGARFVQVSTDYVFDGTAITPYAEDAPVSPLSVYGASKAEGERLVRAADPGAIILRTAWLYGAHGANFVSAVLARGRTGQEVSVLTDQCGQPTWTGDLARRILAVVTAEAPAGTYHATNSGAASRYEFAQEIFRDAGLDPQLVVAATEVAPRPAPRPAYSVLGHDGWAKAGLSQMRSWQNALADAAAHGVLDPAP
ncbi:MAG TPA: dTDP-4-dehydrorhamnose reductase [Galbitalea sp.]